MLENYTQLYEDDMVESFGTIPERDPNGIDAHTPGAKLDAGKPDASLLRDFGLALLAVAEVGTYGAKKYSRGGWQTVTDGYNRYSAADFRHKFYGRYEELDPDTQLLHDAHAAWNALAALELKLRERQQCTMTKSI